MYVLSLYFCRIISVLTLMVLVSLFCLIGFVHNLMGFLLINFVLTRMASLFCLIVYVHNLMVFMLINFVLTRMASLFWLIDFVHNIMLFLFDQFRTYFNGISVGLKRPLPSTSIFPLVRVNVVVFLKRTLTSVSSPYGTVLGALGGITKIISI